jgi:hypothetical protein
MILDPRPTSKLGRFQPMRTYPHALVPSRGVGVLHHPLAQHLFKGQIENGLMDIFPLIHPGRSLIALTN